MVFLVVTPRTGFARLLETGVRMPRKITKKETGAYEKEPGSGVWWIQFKSNGVTRREKIGRRGDAIDMPNADAETLARI
jgi:hypothetical protein